MSYSVLEKQSNKDENTYQMQLNALLKFYTENWKNNSILLNENFHNN